MHLFCLPFNLSFSPPHTFNSFQIFFKSISSFIYILLFIYYFFLSFILSVSRCFRRHLFFFNQFLSLVISLSFHFYHSFLPFLSLSFSLTYHFYLFSLFSLFSLSPLSLSPSFSPSFSLTPAHFDVSAVRSVSSSFRLNQIRLIVPSHANCNRNKTLSQFFFRPIVFAEKGLAALDLARPDCLTARLPNVRVLPIILTVIHPI